MKLRKNQEKVREILMIYTKVLLIKNQDKKIFLILDNLRVHHAKKVKEWQQKHKDKIEFYFLPAYFT